MKNEIDIFKTLLLDVNFFCKYLQNSKRVDRIKIKEFLESELKTPKGYWSSKKFNGLFSPSEYTAQNNCFNFYAMLAEKHKGSFVSEMDFFLTKSVVKTEPFIQKQIDSSKKIPISTNLTNKDFIEEIQYFLETCTEISKIQMVTFIKSNFKINLSEKSIYSYLVKPVEQNKPNNLKITKLTKRQ
jgi:hypothetical protein